MSQVLKTAFLVLLLSMQGIADSNQKDDTEPEEEVPEEMALRSELLRPKMREVSFCFSYHLEILLKVVKKFPRKIENRLLNSD